MASIVKLTIGEIKEYFQSKENIPSPLTEKLVKAGYQQRSGGYIETARKEGLIVDYHQNRPSQYWHLIHSYCDNRDNSLTFDGRIVCGELIFWMAEVTGCVPTNQMEELVDRIIVNAIPQEGSRPLYDRRKWNREIHKICFDAIIQAVNHSIL